MLLKNVNKFMANKKCIIIHGCPSDAEKAMNPETRTYDKHWIPWTKQELEKQGVETRTPIMPEPWQPDYNKFKSEFEKLDVDESTVLVGHSCGCAFLVRWLGESKKKIHKLILVAPWKINDEENDPYREEFYGYSIDETIKERVNEVIMFTANDEEEAGKESLKIFHDALGGEIINIDNYGHYTMGDMGTDKLPKLVEVIVR
jgi:predicted alpha/beta hydrolase family esterase